MIFLISASINQCVDRHDPDETANRLLKINRTSAASIEKPIHNVKVPMDEAKPRQTPSEDGNLCLHIWKTTGRSEEHTSELQSLMRISYAVFCLKKKTKNKKITENE